MTRVAGSLILGGYDRSRQPNTTLTLPLNPDIVVGVQSISIASTNGSSNQILANGIKAAIDTNSPDLWLPTSVCDTIAAELDLTYFAEADRYVIYETARSTIRSSPPTFSFVLGSSTTGGPNVSIDLPYGAFDLQATYPIFNSPAYYFPMRRAANESQYTLGRAFLQEIYLSVDWERSVFNISQALFSSPPLAQEIVSIEPLNRTYGLILQSNGSTEPLTIGAIVGIAAGSLGLILFVILGWRVCSRRRKRTKLSTVESNAPDDFPTSDKEISEIRSNLSNQPGSSKRGDLELDGHQIGEMYAPLEYYGHTQYKHADHHTELVEADSATPIYELPAAIHELPVSLRRDV